MNNQSGNISKNCPSSGSLNSFKFYFRCGESVQRIERAPLGSVYVCSVGGSRYGISGCRRSYFSQRDLQSHIKRRHQREQGGGESDGGEEAENEIQRAMFPQAAPFFPAPLHETIPAVPPRPMLQGERPFGNVGTVPVMDGCHFPPVPTLPLGNVLYGRTASATFCGQWFSHTRSGTSPYATRPLRRLPSAQARAFSKI